MLLLRAGLSYFLAVTALSTFLISAVFYGNAWWREGWTPADWYWGLFGTQVAMVTAPSSLLLVLLACLGRRRPLLDGFFLLAVTGFALGAYAYWGALWSSDPTARSWAGMAWALYIGGMLGIIPAHITTILTLGRTPLLRGLAAPPKTKGPAEASPSSSVAD
ncbi:MAG: hypothetical protein ACO1OG_03060 [Devosia sp.]